MELIIFFLTRKTTSPIKSYFPKTFEGKYLNTSNILVKQHCVVSDAVVQYLEVGENEGAWRLTRHCA